MLKFKFECIRVTLLFTLLSSLKLIFFEYSLKIFLNSSWVLSSLKKLLLMSSKNSFVDPRSSDSLLSSKYIFLIENWNAHNYEGLFKVALPGFKIIHKPADSFKYVPYYLLEKQ